MRFTSSLKKKLGTSQEALNIMFNFQNEMVSNQEGKSVYLVKENRQSWNVFSKSWKDPNVINSFRGLLISQQEFIKSPTRYIY